MSRASPRPSISRSLDPAVVKAVKTNIGDTLSCALAGSSAKAIDVVSGLVKEWAGTPQADMFVFGGKFPAHHAAWVNGGMSHARDYDDTHDAAILHAGVSAVPAAIAAGQLRGKLSGADLIAAVAAGLEVTCRLGVAIKVDIIESGFIYTSLLGYFGATAAAGRALGLTPEEMVNAFGIVYSSVAGNHQVTRDASLMKRLQPGLAAQAAVVAVQLAKRGIRGAQHVFEGADGFFRVYFHDRVDVEKVRDDLGKRFELLNLSYKPYPCCRDTHAAVDAVLQLRAKTETSRKRHQVDPRRRHRRRGTRWCASRKQVRLAPKTIVEAQFSIPYTVAASWIDGKLGMRHFSDEGLTRADILDLAKRVQPYVDADIERDWSRFVTPAQGDREVQGRETRRNARRLSEGPPEERDDRRGIRGQDDGLRDVRRQAIAGQHGRAPHFHGRQARVASRYLRARARDDVTGAVRPPAVEWHRSDVT